MAEEPTNGELFIMLKDIKDQVIKTNGRVTWLEKMMYTAMGGVGVLSVATISNIIKDFFVK